MTPEIKWVSSTDQTDPFIGIVCTPVEYTPEKSSKGAWNRFWKLLELIDFGA